MRPIAVASIALGLLVGGSLLLQNDPPPPSTPTGASGPAPAPVSQEVVDQPVEVPTVTPDSLPTVTAPADPAQKPGQIGRPRGIATSQSTRTDNATSLEREIALLDAVKTKLGAGAAGDAAQALDTYDAEFPQGTLRPEATVLRIRTLLLQGKRPEAQRLADDFLEKHPGSVHAKRIRALLAN